MTGTQNHEGLAGVVAAVDYLASVPGAGADEKLFPSMSPRARKLHAGMAAVQQYESCLGRYLLEALAARPGFKIWGIADLGRLDWRVPTISITREDRTAQQIAEHLARRHIYVWNGNMYALGLSERLGLEERGGFLRIGLIHYNTFEEIDRLLEALDEL